MFNGEVSKQVAIGWLLETYHYIKAFPRALDVAVAHADGELKELLQEYTEHERGHEIFVENTLIKLGISREEVRHSIPLVTTKLINMQMRELFAINPCSALLVAAVVEAGELEEDELTNLQSDFTRHFNFSDTCLEPLFTHTRIDEEFGHSQLAENNPHLLHFSSLNELNNVVNGLHDLKHAFDAQKLEIKEYYSRPGNYFPRQYVDFFAI